MKAPTPTELAQGLLQEEVLGLTLHHEAAGEGRRGMVAVGSVIANRRAWGRWGTKFSQVCTFWVPAKKTGRPLAQFSCWVPEGGRTNHRALVEHANQLRVGRVPPTLRLALDVARDVIAGAEPDPTGGADHYYAPTSMAPPGAVPTWADPAKLTVIIGNHHFFRLRPTESTT